MARANDLSGKRFGRLVAIKPTEERRHGSIVWRCECDCGNTVDIASRFLTEGKTKSCGCIGASDPEDIAGKRFGRLTAIERMPPVRNRHTRWLCRCDCGNEKITTVQSLKNGETSSCGCRDVEQAKKNLARHLQTAVVDGTNLDVISRPHTRDTTSGIKGVSWNKPARKWVAYITFQGRRHHLGCYDDLADAAEARREAEQELFDPVLEAHGRTPTSEEEYEEALSTKLQQHAKGDGPNEHGEHFLS